MTITNTNASETFPGTGSTTVFNTAIKMDNASHAVVSLVTDATLASSPQTLNVDYTVSDLGVEAGCTITMTTAPASGTTLVVERNRPYTQTVDIQNQGGFNADTVEDGYDYLAQQIQQLRDISNRSVRVDAFLGAQSEYLIANKM